MRQELNNTAIVIIYTVLLLLLALTCDVHANPPTGYPYRIRGSQMYQGLYMGDLILAWNDDSNGYMGLGQALQQQEDGSWTSGDGWTWLPETGSGLFEPPHNEDWTNVIKPYYVDYGMGTEEEPTVLAFTVGMSVGVATMMFATIMRAFLTATNFLRRI